jgi:hypothetical protein
VNVCGTCGYTNPTGALLCENCGRMLVSGGRGDTRRIRITDTSPKPLAKVEEKNLHFPVGRKFSLQLRELKQPLMFSVDGGALVIGRRDKLSEYIPDIDFYDFAGYLLGISRKHAVIYRQEDKLMIEDLGSSNGTFTDGRQIPAHTPTPILHNSELRLGDLTMKVRFH